MLLADCCFNITHESFSADLDEIVQRAEDHKVQYFFAPASKESEILKLLNFCENYDEKIYCSVGICLLYTSPSPRDATLSRMPSSA